MKNIYVWPTAKPSRVYQTNLGNYYFVKGYIPDTVQTCKNHNIYITTGGLIKLWDWYLIEFNGLQITQCTSEEELTSIEGRGDCIKIALTTDYDLIQSGVQPVDDEFLKWFVKNPSCEEIEVEDYPGEYVHTSNWIYEIIIPDTTADFINYPPELEPVLAKISHQNDLGLSTWYEVVYWADEKWSSYSGSKTFENGERVLEWVECQGIFKNN